MILKDFVPPVLIKLIRRNRETERQREYDNYTLALEDCTVEAYQNIELCNTLADKTNIYLKQLNEKPFTLNPTNVFLLSAINQYITTFSADKINILDFGGACGAHYYEIRRFIPDRISLNWHVVETPQMVLSAIDKKLNNSELHFINSLTDINTKIDFIHSSGVLQYVPDPYLYLIKLIQLKANWVFFNRMMFNENDRDFITIQKSNLSSNGPGPLPEGYSDMVLSYPHTTMSFLKFNTEMLKEYNLEWIFEELSGSYKINNERISGKGLLYIRKNGNGI